jgi:hypothetical protein
MKTQKGGVVKMKRASFIKFVCALTMTTFILASSAWAEPWKFGVISDTQWTIADDGKNPNTCAADIIKQIDQQFIASDVKLVVHVGDMMNTGSQINDYTRALYAQDLYNAGIGFYPLRGNHEAANGTYTGSGDDFMHAYPQIVPGFDAGVNNNTPADITSAIIPAADMDPITGNPPADKINPNTCKFPFNKFKRNKNIPDTFSVGTHFSAPDDVNADTGGVSYAFQYNNATFMLLDQFKSPDYYTSYIPEQQPWIEATLSSRPANTHAFAFTHKNILGGNHKDNMFGGNATGDPGDGYGLDPSTVITNTPGLTVGGKQAAENAFLASMQANKGKYVISGHDHHHYNSVVTSPDGHSKVHQLITQSDSSKFYTPGLPVSGNDVPVEQDLARVGYYIFTVDGPRVTVDYYADDHGSWQSDSKFPYAAIDPVQFPLGKTPPLHFIKRSTTGYSLNGKENLVAQGAPYAMTDDTIAAEAASKRCDFVGTSMAILDGINRSTTTTNYGKKTEKAVNTGWAPAEGCLSSDILTLWGMADLGTEQTDTYVLSMSFDKRTPRKFFDNKGFGIATRDSDGRWVNAADMNFGGATKFVKGPWKPGYVLGTYGVDANTKTAWAVINYDGDFAVAANFESGRHHR